MLATEKNLVWRYPSDVDRETVNTFTIICFFIDQNKRTYPSRLLMKNYCCPLKLFEPKN